MHVFPAAFHAIFHEKERAQVVERARDFIVEAVCPDDEVIEAVRWRGPSYLAAVQWHPEFHQPAEQGVIDDAPILKDFLDAAQAARVAA